MAGQMVTVEHEAALTPAQAEALPFGQAHWWLRMDGGDFVKLSKKVRGDAPFKQVLSLEPGRYVLGVGTASDGVRVSLVVEAGKAPPPAPAPKAKAGAKATLDLAGKSVVLTGDLDAFDRDAATSWLEGLGASVKGSVSSKTNYVVAGRDPGAKKLEKAKELGIPVLTEAQLREQLGLEPASSAAPAAAKVASADRKPAAGGSGKKKLERLWKELAPSSTLINAAEKMVGPDHFRDLGMTDDELWGFVIGPRGGSYTVHIAFNDRPRYAVRCHRDYRLCAHAVALMLTAQRHFVPPAPAPANHREAARYESAWE